jgi:hypothetical protein
VDENVLSTVLRRDETEALVVVEKLYRTGRHDILFPYSQSCGRNVER